MLVGGAPDSLDGIIFLDDIAGLHHTVLAVGEPALELTVNASGRSQDVQVLVAEGDLDAVVTAAGLDNDGQLGSFQQIVIIGLFGLGLFGLFAIGLSRDQPHVQGQSSSTFGRSVGNNAVQLDIAISVQLSLLDQELKNVQTVEIQPLQHLFLRVRGDGNGLLVRLIDHDLQVDLVAVFCGQGSEGNCGNQQHCYQQQAQQLLTNCFHVFLPPKWINRITLPFPPHPQVQYPGAVSCKHYTSWIPIRQ